MTSSIVREPIDNLALSNAIRPGVVGWSKSLARELGPEGITVNCLAPGTNRHRSNPRGVSGRAERGGPGGHPAPAPRHDTRDRRRRRVPLLRAGRRTSAARSCWSTARSRGGSRREREAAGVAVPALGLLGLVAAYLLWALPMRANDYLVVPDKAKPLAAQVASKEVVRTNARRRLLRRRLRPADPQARAAVPFRVPAGATRVPADAIAPAGTTRRGTDCGRARRTWADREQIASVVALHALGYRRRLRDAARRARHERLLGRAGRKGAAAGGRHRLGRRRPGSYPAGAALRDGPARPGRRPCGSRCGATTRRRRHRPDGGQPCGPEAGDHRDPGRPGREDPAPVPHRDRPRQGRRPVGWAAVRPRDRAPAGTDVTHGCRVAATGELALDGCVLPIGGIKQKTIGARRGHVDFFLVPAGDNAQGARKNAHGLTIIPVAKFSTGVAEVDNESAEVLILQALLRSWQQAQIAANSSMGGLSAPGVPDRMLAGR